MEQVRQGLQTLLHPPFWLRTTLPPISFAVLSWVLLEGDQGGPLAYLSYCTSAYSLVLCLLPLSRLVRRMRAAVLGLLNSTAFGRKYAGDLAFRGQVGIVQALAVNTAHVVFRAAVGIRYGSVWSLSIAAYDLTLGLLRLALVLGCRRRRPETEGRLYRATAWLLFLLNIPMGGMMVLMVLTDSGFTYPGHVIYLSALYTFYAFAMSIVNVVKFRKLGSPILSAAKVLNLVAALMSVLALQTALLTRFSPEEHHFRAMMNAITGGGIWLAVVLIAVYMLLRYRKMNGRVRQ